MKKIILLAIALLAFVSCEDEEPQPVDLKSEYISISDASIDNQGKFTCKKEADYYKCTFTTVQIRKQQNVSSMLARYQGDELFIQFFLDKDLFPEPLDRVTQIEFNLYEIPKGRYSLKIGVENVFYTVSPATWVFE